VISTTSREVLVWPTVSYRPTSSLADVLAEIISRHDVGTVDRVWMTLNLIRLDCTLFRSSGCLISFFSV